MGSIAAEALAPEGIVAKAIEILGLLGKGEGIQGLGLLTVGRHLPDGGFIRIEVLRMRWTHSLTAHVPPVRR
jgi:hypothetical protein